MARWSFGTRRPRMRLPKSQRPVVRLVDTKLKDVWLYSRRLGEAAKVTATSTKEGNAFGG